MSPARSVTFESDGLLLEGRFAVPTTTLHGVAVLCHAYPPQGGSMSNPMLPFLQRSVEAAEWAALRFNFRGVGRSEGTFDHGLGEKRDALAALSFVRAEHPGVPAAVIGWSFGALVALQASIEGGAEYLVGIAPPINVGGMDLPAIPPGEWPARSLLVCGSEDQWCDAAELGRLAARFGSEVHVIPGADHAFNGKLDQLGAAVAGFLNR